MEIELRGGMIAAEIRAIDDEVSVSGYAAVFDEVADIAGSFRERIVPGAFANAIGRDDVPFLINHDGLPLARTGSSTLALREDQRGLYMETRLRRDDPDVQRIVPKMERGDLSKMSFAFRAVKQVWDDTDDPPLRTIEEVKLFDVSIVTEPAYDGTEIGLRSLAKHREQIIRARNFHAVRKRRMRMNLSLRG